MTKNPVLWEPSEARKKNALIQHFKSQVEVEFNIDLPDYKSLWRWSIDHKEEFWSKAWDFGGVIGEKGDIILENGDDMERAAFFPNGTLNFAENMLRRRDDAPALIFRAEDKVEETVTFKQLYDRGSQMVQGLKTLGVTKGDRVAAYLPNMPEAIIGCLGAASLGALWSSASPDFGVQGVLDRFGQVEPKVLIACAGYYYNGKTHSCLDKVEKILKQLPSVEKLILVPFADPNPDLNRFKDAILFDDFLDQYTPNDIDFVPVEFNHPLYIMFSSGTTGVPKCIVHRTGGVVLSHIVYHMLHSDTKRDDRVFYFTTTGWMMWQWLISGLMCEATVLLYDGSPFYPDGNVLFDFADDHKMTFFGTSAKYVDALKKHGLSPAKTHDLSSIKGMGSTGSPLVHEAFDYIYSDIKSDLHVSSLSGGTDIVGCFVIGNPISPVHRGEIQGPGLGKDVDVFDDNGQPVPASSGPGELVCTSCFPNQPLKFWNDEDGQKYHNAYFADFDNVWAHGDWIEKTSHDGFIIHGRSDATLNPGGVRIGTSEIYRQVEKIDDILESIAVGQSWEEDVRVVLFVRLRDGVVLSEDLISRIKSEIRKGASPRHVPEKILAVSDIPRTKSGKITELAVKNIIEGRAVKNVEALANPESLELYEGLEELRA